MYQLASTPVLEGRPAPTAEIVIRLLKDSLSALDDGHSAKARIARAYSLLEAEHERADRPAEAPVRGGLAPWQVRRVKAHIDENLEAPITTTDLAPAARLSPHYFARAFKQTFGLTPHVYVFRRRMERAVEMMLTTNEPLSHIALACGFADQAHFTRRFHRAMGATPHAWRRERLGGALAAAA